MVVTLEELHGRAREVTSATTITLDESVKLWYVNMTAAGQQVRMPDARKLRPGGSHFVVVIRSGSNSVTIADNAGTPIVTSDGTSTLAALTRGLVLLMSDATAAGDWIVKKDAVTVATNPSPVEFFYEAGGGNTTGGAGPRRVRRYNHQLDTWLTGTDKSHDVKEGGGFRIGAVGGVWHGNNASPRNKVEHYDPDVWTVKTDSPRNHESFAAAGTGSTGTKGYAIGGLQSTTNQDTDEYTLSGDSWALRATLPQELRSVGYGVDYAGYVYVLWGQIDGSGNTVGLVYRYEPVSNVYAAMAPSPSLFLEDFGACAFDGFILKAGGRATLVARSEQVHLYEISLNAWVQKLDYPIPAATLGIIGAAMAAPENVPIMCGGSRGITNNVLRSDRYFRLTDVWVQKADLPQGPGFLSNHAISGTP